MKRITQLLKISETAAIMCMSIAGLFVFFAAAGLLATTFIYPFERPALYVSGLFLGCLLSVAKVILLERGLERSLDLDSASSSTYSILMSIMRYMLTIGVLLLVFLFRNVFGLFGAVTGIVSLQLAAYITTFVLNKKDATF